MRSRWSMGVILLKIVFGVRPLRGCYFSLRLTPPFRAGLTHAAPPALENSWGAGIHFRHFSAKVQKHHNGPQAQALGRRSPDLPITRDRPIFGSPSNPPPVRLEYRQP